MQHSPFFCLQEAIYFIMLPFLVPVLFAFNIRMWLNLNAKFRCQKVNVWVKKLLVIKLSKKDYHFQNLLKYLMSILVEGGGGMYYWNRINLRTRIYVTFILM
jgi:flagellar biosynthesis protein FlhB